MATGRLIRLSNQPGDHEFPLYVVAEEEGAQAIELLKRGGVGADSVFEDIGPVSERVLALLGLTARQFKRLERDINKRPRKKAANGAVAMRRMTMVKREPRRVPLIPRRGSVAPSSLVEGP
jgi:hypothetical protein